MGGGGNRSISTTPAGEFADFAEVERDPAFRIGCFVEVLTESARPTLAARALAERAARRAAAGARGAALFGRLPGAMRDVVTPGASATLAGEGDFKHDPPGGPPGPRP